MGRRRLVQTEREHASEPSRGRRGEALAGLSQAEGSLDFYRALPAGGRMKNAGGQPRDGFPPAHLAARQDWPGLDESQACRFERRPPFRGRPVAEMGQPSVESREIRSPRRAGQERAAYKLRVRRLKALGLTESLERGYRLSPRGRAYLEA